MNISTEWIIAIATALGVIISMFTIWFRQREHQKTEISQQVELHVNAKYGELIEKLDGLRRNAEEQMKAIEQRLASLTAEIDSRSQMAQQMIEKSELSAERIESQLQKANVILPSLRQVELIPTQLYFMAKECMEINKIAPILTTILEHSESDSRILEYSGDLARTRLFSNALAVKLYERSVQVDPSNISAKAEYLFLLALDSRKRESAYAQMIDLATRNPNNTNIIQKLMNLMVQLDDYEKIITIGKELLPVTKEKAIVWRNIATARNELGFPEEEIEAAYQEALTIGDDTDFGNTAAQYSRFLIKVGKLEKAYLLLRDAMRINPSYAQLHLKMGDVLKKMRRYREAAVHYHLFCDLGDMEDRDRGQKLLRDLKLLQDLQLDQPDDEIDETQNKMLEAEATVS